MATGKEKRRDAAAQNAHPLDRVIWRALTTRQREFSRAWGAALKFEDAVGPLSAFSGEEEEGYEFLAGLAGPGGVVGLFLDAPYSPRRGWELIATASLLQMVREVRGDTPELPSSSVKKIGAGEAGEMQALAALVRPGPFGPRTHELGDFFGVFQDGALAAMAGERLKVPGYTEVSAVCTHPRHAGKGYAAALMRRVVAGIEGRGEVPFLHVRGDNARAIALYERLGFRLRSSGHFAALRRKE